MKSKLLNLNHVLRLKRTNPTLSSLLVNKSSALCLTQATSTTSIRNLGYDSFGKEFPEPYVDKPYSYAYGKSNNHLIYKTIGQLFEERGKFDNGRPFIVSHHENISKNYEQFFKEVNQLAKGFHEQLGLKRGDVVGLWSCNTYDWILIQYACARIGLILCTINPFYQTYELNYALRKSEVKTLFMPGKQSMQNKVNRFAQIIIKTLEITDESSALDLHLENIVTLDGECFTQNDIPSLQRINLFEFDKIKTQSTGELDSSITNAVTADDPFTIMFTSGTTGRPKGACLSHFNVTNNVILSGCKHQIYDGSNLCLPLPFFHAFAGVLGNLAPLVYDVQVVIPCLKYNVQQLTEAINQHKVTHMYATPTLAMDLMNHLRYNNLQTPTLKCLIAGGASVPVEITHQFVETIPSCQDFRIGYGSTECGPCCTSCTPLHSREQCTETVGAPLDFVEIKLIDPQTKQLVKLGETGEIHTRGHNVMLGYWKEPEKTKEVLDCGWYNTGDLGTMDEKGLLKIIGRTKELIIVGGENVYPREIEEILYTHPAIETVNVIGVPDPRTGEQICAWVQLHQNVKLTEEELREFCKEKITYFKVPKYILFVNEFPMTPTGKAQKFIMREMTIKKLNLDDKKSKTEKKR